MNFASFTNGSPSKGAGAGLPGERKERKDGAVTGGCLGLPVEQCAGPQLDRHKLAHVRAGPRIATLALQFRDQRPTAGLEQTECLAFTEICAHEDLNS
jgi:hypothetical protein